MFPVLRLGRRGRSFRAFSRHEAAHFEMSRHIVDRDDAASLQICSPLAKERPRREVCFVS